MALFPNSDLRRILRSGIKNLGILVLLWVLFSCVYKLVPYTKAGDEVIYETKVNKLLSSVEFPTDAKYKIAVFGSSVVLSGFIPDVFDNADTNTYSYNLGLPASGHFVFALELLIKRNQIPTHVFLTTTWPKEEQKTAFSLPHDKNIIETLFPFQSLPRNLTLFFLRSRNRGGIVEYYQAAKRTAEQMLAGRGYYFIEGQSHFPNHRLPDEFKLQSDTPDIIRTRFFDTTNPIFKKLIEIHNKHDIKFYIVPTYRRAGSAAQCSLENKNADVFKNSPGLHVLGPEYYLFVNRYFSDATHVNPEGAELYTKKLRELFDENIVTTEATHYYLNK